MSKGFSRPVPHEEFIRQKYLSKGDESEERQKKKRLVKAATKWNKIRIHDDDLDLKKMDAEELDSDEELQYRTQEERPVIAAVIDERPLHLKRKEFKSRWVTVEGPDDDSEAANGQLPAEDEPKTSEEDKSGKRRDSEKERRERRKSEKSVDEKKTKYTEKSSISSKQRHEQKNPEDKKPAIDPDLLLGKGAKTIYRDKSGRIRDLEKEKEDAKKQSEVDDEKKAKYKEWSMGLKQREDQKRKAEEAIHEMSKPLARLEDDEDLDKLLREKEQDEDPMLQYMRKKKWKEKVKEADEKGEKILEKPKYNGPTPPPLNRYGIQPGYRWDGVDRSNGYERDYFAKIAEKTAIREEAYRWSTEDM